MSLNSDYLWALSQHLNANLIGAIAEENIVVLSGTAFKRSNSGHKQQGC